MTWVVIACMMTTSLNDRAESKYAEASTTNQVKGTSKNSGFPRVDPRDSLRHLEEMEPKTGSEPIFRGALKINKEISASLAQEGFTQLRNGLSRNALITFEQAKAIDPLNSTIRFGLARSLQDEDQKVRALEEYTISIFLDPTYAKAYANRALVKGALQDLAGALDDLETAIKIDKNMAPAYLNRGVTLAALNKPKFAIRDFDRAIEIDPRYADAYRNRGITRNFLGDLRGACSDWKKAGNLGQADPWVWYRQLCLKPAADLRSKGLRHPGQH